MTKTELEILLNQVASGQIQVCDAVLQIQREPFEDLGYARVDWHRGMRQNVAEVIYGAGKTAEQIAGIVRSLQKAREKGVLITRLDSLCAQELKAKHGIELIYHDMARIGIVGEMPIPKTCGKIVVATGGTSDMPVAEEAALTAQFLGNEVIRLYDVGVAGLHRILSKLDVFMSARVIIAVAGMEGALPSVIAGLVSCPVIAVPTSIGYGASFGGVSALLSMLNSCASGVSVVNIDNGFGAAFQASLINTPLSHG
ncbi:MAG: nickel pincer cofactor biosynthesis protein LarB [Proteobacteria bacterium]|nr:nickel pincer cofactor biosynthesis protein LarB [Pseudomonadota bacterium]